MRSCWAFLRADSSILYFGSEYQHAPLSQTFIRARDNNKVCEKNAVNVDKNDVLLYITK